MAVSHASYREGECNTGAKPTLVRNSSQTAHCEWPGTLRALRRVPKKNAVGGSHRIGNGRLWNFAPAETYQYDADNNLTQKTDRKNQTIQYVYD